MAAQRQEAAQGVNGAGTAPGSGWKPSRFFEAWKEDVPAIKGALAVQCMRYCRGMPADVRLEAIEQVLRATMPYVYVSDDNSEAFVAMDNDGDAMRECATQFFDEFWNDYRKDFLAERRADAEPAAAD